jgi:hypothetical protein
VTFGTGAAFAAAAAAAILVAGFYRDTSRKS